MNMIDRSMMEETIPRLATAMQSVLADAQVHVLGQQQIDIIFDGLPSWKISVVRKLVSNQYQMIETQIDLMPLCIASMSASELQRLAAIENIGLRGVTVLPLQSAMNDERAGLRVRAAFVGQKGQTTDEVENLAIDILTVLSFARTLEDRVTDNSVAGEFSFELYKSRLENPANALPARFITTGQNVFEGSQDRVFSEIMKGLKLEFSFDVRTIGERTALVRAPGSELEIVAKIPNDIPIFVIHAPLLKLTGMTSDEVWSLLEELNSHGEAGHFEADINNEILSFTAWKHLTNDLRNFSFDHIVFSVIRAHAMASECVYGAPILPPDSSARNR